MSAKIAHCPRALCFQASSRARKRRIRAMAASPAVGGLVTVEMFELAQNIANAASSVTTSMFRTKLDVLDKDDCSPVTVADRAAEAAMRDCVSSLFPEHAIFGEEGGYTPGSGEGADWMWVFDPIDGTKAFITGKPTWGTLIALLYKGTPVLGVIDQPVLKERWIGVEGRQTLYNGQPVTTRSCPDLSSAYMYSTTPLMFTGASDIAYRKLQDQVKVPLFGCDCYAYGLLASGFTDLVVEADLKPYDYLAVVPIVKGAGGVITDWNDRELVWNPEAGEGDLSITAWAGAAPVSPAEPSVRPEGRSDDVFEDDADDQWPQSEFKLNDTAREGTQELLTRYHRIVKAMDHDVENFSNLLQSMTDEYVGRMTAAKSELKKLVLGYVKDWADGSDQIQQSSGQLDHDKHLVELLNRAVATRSYNIPVEAADAIAEPAQEA